MKQKHVLGRVGLLTSTIGAWAIASFGVPTNDTTPTERRLMGNQSSVVPTVATNRAAHSHAGAKPSGANRRSSASRAKATPKTVPMAASVLTPVPGARSGSFEEVSRILPRQSWNCLNGTQRDMVRAQLRMARAGQPLPQVCFAPGTPPEVIQAFEAVDNSLSPYRIGGIWTASAQDASVNRGGPLRLTWNLVADGVTTPTRTGGTAPSDLQARFNSIYGEANSATLRRILREVFARYEQLTGIRYTEVAYDDGAAISGNNGGIIGTRADIRIGGNAIDGNSNVLAFNYFPNYGDMIIDTTDNTFTFTNNDSQILRNTVSHEQGHGLGLDHVCPADDTKLMEPSLSISFTGPQLDDILALQRSYGDTYEAPANNDSSANATSLGTLAPGTVSRDTISVDGTNDVDMFAFSLDGVGRSASVTVTPSGSTYLEGEQIGGTCTAGTNFDPTNQSNLGVELVDNTGQVLAVADAAAAGSAEAISAVGLSGTGPYYVRVKSSGTDAVQGYSFALTTAARANAAPQVSVSVSPTQAESTSILTATASATDPDGGTPTLAYVWRRNGTVISGQSGTTLDLNQVPNVGPGDVIRIEVIASDGSTPNGQGAATAVVREAAGLVVTTLSDVVADDGQTSLREAVNYANTLGGTQAITFTVGLNGTINLVNEFPAFAGGLTSLSITGPSATSVSISGQDTRRFWQLASGKSLSVSNLTFTNGYEPGGSSGGGLFLLDGATFTATDCAFNQSEAWYLGGVIYGTNTASTLTLTRCSFSANKAYYGGAINLNNGTLTLQSCSFDGNLAGVDGGAIRTIATANTITGCTFANNAAGTEVAGANGGAIRDSTGTLTIRNSTFTANTCNGNGGGVFDFGGTSRTVNCTFSGNTATDGASLGSAIYQVQSTQVIINTILNAPAGTAVTLGRNGGTGTADPTSTNNIASDGAGGILPTVGSNQLNTNAALNALADNGGLVKTMSLQNGSPAIDAGLLNVQGAPDNLTTDARGPGFARQAGTSVDIGAFERGGETLSINDVAISEGNAGTTNATFTVTLAAASSQTITVDYATAPGTTNPATAGSDYTTQSGTLTFAPGDLTKTVIVPIIGDTSVESDETFFVNLTSITQPISDAQGIGTITNDDAPPSAALSINDQTITEGDASTQNMTFTVTLALASSQTITVDYATAPGTTNPATAGSDYTTQSGTLTFAPGDLTKTITVPIVGDTLDENDETFFVNLSNPTNATVNDAQGLGTITDNDASPSLGINDVTLTETNGGTAQAQFTLTLSAVSGRSVSVVAQTASNAGSPAATAGSDYTALGATTVTFTPGQTTKTVNVTILGDTLDEPDEKFALNLSGAVNATISDASGVCTILDNDAAPLINVSAPNVTEGNAGTVTMTFTVSLSAASARIVTVQYKTNNASTNTATAGSDYVAIALTTLTFAPGETTKTVSVTVNGDTLDEDNERIALALSAPANATLGTINDGIIVDDDATPTLVINDISVNETNGGSAQAAFTLTLSAASGRTITVTAQSAAGGSPAATAGADYTNIPATTITFTPGQTTRPVNVTVLGDIIDENDEKFVVNLSGATNVTLADNSGTCTIVDNDAPPLINASAPNLTEGNAGTQTMAFTLSLSAASARNISVQYQTANAATFPATTGADYTAVPLTTVIFLAGETTKTVNVTVNGDLLDEENERISLNLTNPINVTLGTISDGIIVDDDATPSLSINDVSQVEGNSGTSQMVFTITLSAASGRTVTVYAQSAAGGSPAATAGSDYVALPQTLVTFAPGQTTKTVSVTINGDTSLEQNEKFVVNLSGYVNAGISDNSGQGTITNDDAAGIIAPAAPADEPSE